MKKAVLFLLCFFYFSSLKAEVACPVFNVERVSLTNPRKAASTFFIPENPAVITSHITFARFGFGSYDSEVTTDNGTKSNYEGQFHGIGISLGGAEDAIVKERLDSFGINTKGMVGAARFDQTDHSLKNSNETNIGLKNSSENYSSTGQAYGVGLFKKIIQFGYANRRSSEERNGNKINLDETTRGFAVNFGILRYGRSESNESYSSSELGSKISRRNLANGICFGFYNGPYQKNDTNYYQIWAESFEISKPNYISEAGNFGKELTKMI